MIPKTGHPNATRGRVASWARPISQWKAERARQAAHTVKPLPDCCVHYYRRHVRKDANMFTCPNCFKEWLLVTEDEQVGWSEITI